MILRRSLFCVATAMLSFSAMSLITTSGWAQSSNRPSARTVNPAAPLPSAPTPAPRSSGPAGTQFGPPNFADGVLPTDQNFSGFPTPGTPPAAPTRPVSTANNSTRNNSPFSPRLARAPFLLGDSFAPSIQIQTGLSSFHDEPSVLLPQGGGATRAKIAENSAALPMDRVIFNYNHFHNAVDDFDQSTNADRFTLGFEKIIFDGLASVDVRLPLTANNDISTATFGRNGSELGNLSVSLKALLSSDRDSAFVAGMTIDIPTGEGISATLNRDTTPLNIVASNDALHLAPFLGFLFAPGDLFTHQGFLQIDVPTNANAIQFSDASPALVTTELLEQTLLYVDYSLSTLIYDAGRSSRNGHDVRRISGLTELHYTTTLEDSDAVLINTALNTFSLTSLGNRLDVLNLTLGLHTVLNNGTQLRFGTVTPLTDDDDRYFDFEVQAQVNIPL